MPGATATESTRDQIIHAAADSLLENGYSGTSVRSIASKAGVAIGNLQYWFPTKSELLVEAWRYLTARSVEELREALNQLTDPLEVLEVGVESIWDSLRRLGDIQLAAFDLLVQAPRTERLRAYLPELFTRYREVIQEQLDRLEDRGVIPLTRPRGAGGGGGGGRPRRAGPGRPAGPARRSIDGRPVPRAFVTNPDRLGKQAYADRVRASCRRAVGRRRVARRRTTCPRAAHACARCALT